MQIQDLSKQLDRGAMSAVRGGDNGDASATTILQQMGISTPITVGYGAGSAGNTFINVSGSQNATVKNKETSGDEFAAFLGALEGLKA